MRAEVVCDRVLRFLTPTLFVAAFFAAAFFAAGFSAVAVALARITARSRRPILSIPRRFARPGSIPRRFARPGSSPPSLRSPRIDPPSLRSPRMSGPVSPRAAAAKASPR